MRTDWVLPVRGLYPGEDIASYTETTTRRLSTWAWHWFRQVTGPCNVACGSGIMTVNLPSGNTLQCDTWLWDDMPLNSPGEWWQHHAVWQSHSSGIMTLNSPGRITLQCDTTLGSWHWNGQVAAPCNVAGGSGMICHGIHTIRPPYWTSGFDFDHITAVNMSFCISLRNFIQIGPPSAENNDVMSIFKMADLRHFDGGSPPSWILWVQ